MSKEELTEEQTRLVLDNLRLAWKFSHKFQAENGGDLNDYYSCACMGLTEAARSFDPSRGAQFSTLAVISIRRWIFRHFLESEKRYKRLVRCSIHRPIGKEKEDTLEDILESSEVSTSEKAFNRISTEEVEEFILSLRPEYQDIIIRRMLGQTFRSIAKDQGCTTRVIYWKLQKIKSIYIEWSNKRNETE